MTFQEKLQFLMKITQTSNKELAVNISVDPSLISLLRTGRRKMPHNKNNIRKMAAYFAMHSEAEYQRQAIAEMLDMPVLRSVSDARMESAIYEWLCKEATPISRMLDVLADVPMTPSDISVPCSSSETLTGSNHHPVSENRFFYGTEGIAEAFEQSLKIHYTIDNSSEFYVVSGESMEWLMDDYLLRKEYMIKFLDSVKHGMHVFQIMPSMNLLSRCVDSVRQWLPLYATGQVEAYYYPRLRDNLYSRHMLILPGVYAMVSTAVGPDFNNCITLLTTDSKMIQALTEEFHLLLSQCRPALKTYTSPEDAADRFRILLSQKGDVLQMVSPMSVPSSPPELLEDCISSTSNTALAETYRLYLDSSRTFEDKLNHNTFVDLSRLPSIQEIQSGNIPVILPYKVMPEQPCYTPGRYLLHLRNILRLLEKYENYHFVPVDDPSLHAYNLITVENGTAILAKNTEPPLFLEIDRPIIIQACQEHLYRLAGQIGYKGIYRYKIKSRIRVLIQELEFLIDDADPAVQED